MGLRYSISFLKSVYWLGRKYPAGQRLSAVIDYLKLFRTKGIETDEYYDFGMFSSSEDFRKSFLGLNEQRFYLDYLNPIRYYSLSRNKYLAHKILEASGVAMPEFYCHYLPEGIPMPGTDCASSLEGVLSLLSIKGVKECIIKETEGSHGNNVMAIDEIEYGGEDAVMMRFDGKRILLSEILKDKSLIFEQRIKQSAELLSLNPDSVNTVRIMTALYPSGEARVVGAFFRIGRAGKCFDNIGFGGNVDAGVNLETGEIINPVRYDGFGKVYPIRTHPDSGTVLEGFRIENWNMIKETVEGWQKAFPYCKVAGWDVAITDEGPVALEVNDFWDRIGQLFIGKGWRKEVRDCYLAWQETRRKYYLGRRQNRLSQKHLNRIVSYE